MRRAPLCALLLLPAGFAGAQSTGQAKLEKFINTLNAAQTLNVTYSVQPVNGAANTIKLDLAKPNFAKIDSASELVIADGTNILTYDKKHKTYYKRPQNAAEFRKLVTEGDLYLWYGFFDKNVASKVGAVKSLGTKDRKGATYDVVQFSIQSGRPTILTYYLSQTDFIARVAEVDVKTGDLTDSIVYDAKVVNLGAKVDSNVYAFKPPAGSRELSAAELNAGKWYTNLQEALQVAKDTNKIVMVMFSADW